MKNLNLRNIPDELHRDLKIFAAGEGKSMAEIVLKFIAEGIKKK
jgi:plasmid stability protein